MAVKQVLNVLLASLRTSVSDGLFLALWQTGVWRLMMFLLIYSTGLATIYPITPTLMTNGFASLAAGHSIDCTMYTPATSLPECVNAHSTAAVWMSWTNFVSSSLLTFLCAPYVGHLSDRIGRKPFMLAGISLMFLPLVVIQLYLHGLVPIYWYYPASAAGGLVSSFTMALTSVADLLEQRHRATAVGYLTSCFSVGMLVGPLLGGYLSVRAALWACMGTTAVTLMYVAAFVPECAPGPLARRRRAAAAAEAAAAAAAGRISGDKGAAKAGTSPAGQSGRSGAVGVAADAAVAAAAAPAGPVEVVTPTSTGKQGGVSDGGAGAPVNAVVVVGDPDGDGGDTACSRRAAVAAAALAAAEDVSLLSAQQHLFAGAAPPPAGAAEAAGAEGAAAAVVLGCDRTHLPAACPSSECGTGRRCRFSSGGGSGHAAAGPPPCSSSSSPEAAARCAAGGPAGDGTGGGDEQPPSMLAGIASGWAVIRHSSYYQRIAAVWVVVSMTWEGAGELLMQYLQLKLGYNTKDQADVLVVLASGGLVVKLGLLALLVRWLGERRLLAFGLAAYAAECVALALAPTKALGLAAVSIGSLASVCWPALVALQTAGVDPSQQGAVFGALQAISSMASGLGPLVFASVFRAVSRADSSLPHMPGIVWYMAAGLSLVAMAIALTLPPQGAAAATGVAAPRAAAGSAAAAAGPGGKGQAGAGGAGDGDVEEGAEEGGPRGGTGLREPLLGKT